MDRYQLESTENTCVALPDNCEVVANGSCTKCLPSYMLDSDSGNCVLITIKNCDQVKSGDSTKCEKCVSGYYSTSDGTCAALSISHCASGTSKRCLTCVDGYKMKLDGSQCTNSESCMISTFNDKFICYLCDFSNSYFATDVVGDQQIIVGDRGYQQQVCTKAGSGNYSNIASVAAIFGILLLRF